MVRHAPIHRRSGHSDIAICCGRNVRGSSPSTSVVPLSNQVTTLNHKRFKGFKMFSDGHLVMVEAIAMATGRDLLGEGAKEPLRVWYHNGEDNMIELQRRVGAICQHYDIPMEELENGFFMTSGNEVPLRVAETWSQVRLQTDHRL